MASLATLSALCPSPASSYRKTMPIRSHQNRPYKVEGDSDDEEEIVRKISPETSTTSTKTASTRAMSSSKTHASSSNAAPPPFSQEEEEMRLLQSSGALNHVAGETSLLSQEILAISQPESAPAPSQMNPEKVGLVTIQEEAKEQTTTKKFKSSPQRHQLLEMLDNPTTESSQGGGSLLHASQLSVLMDAAEIMAGLEGRQHTIDGVPIPESYVYDESQASQRSSSRLAAAAAARSVTEPPDKASAATKEVTPPPPTAATTTPVSKEPLPPIKSAPSKGKAVVKKLAKPAPPPYRKSKVLDTIHVSATPTSMIIRLPNSSNSSTSKKRKNTSVLQPSNKIMTSFKSAGGRKGSAAAALTPQKKRKMQRERDRRQAQEMAQQAAQLAAQTIASPEVAKNLLLSMALVRINPRAAPSEWPRAGAVITDGFFWGTYPPLETILRSHMREYYELSTTKCQSKLQQQFNNALTIDIRAESDSYGWDFAPNFDDKVLRDRIRCFFKTHIQNAKKRLRTMLKNPTKKANAKALVAHLALIHRYSKEDDEHKPIYNPVIGDLVKVDVPEDVDETTMRKIKFDDDGDENHAADDDHDMVDDSVVDHEAEMHVDAKQVLSLGFMNLSQDEKIKEQQQSVPLTARVDTF